MNSKIVFYLYKLKLYQFHIFDFDKLANTEDIDIRGSIA